MRPHDLKSDYTWETRRPYLKDGILFVPKHYFEHEAFKMPSMQEIFSNNNPVTVEYCSGNGDWIIEKAKAHPEQNFIAVEMLFERVRKIYSKRENQRIKNLLIVCGEAMTFSKYYLKQRVISNVYVNFPDPWPKARHAKHRLINDVFLDELLRVMQSSAHFYFTTDDDTYALNVAEQVSSNPAFASEYPHPYYRTDVENYGSSFFESLWRKKGKSIKFLKFRVI